MSSTPVSRHAINNIPSMDSMSYCPRNIHTANYIRYCLTCSQPFCVDCGIGHHGKHTYVNFVDFLGRAVMQAKETMNEVRLSLNVLQTDLDKVEVSELSRSINRENDLPRFSHQQNFNLRRGVYYQISRSWNKRMNIRHKSEVISIICKIFLDTIDRTIYDVVSKYDHNQL